MITRIVILIVKFYEKFLGTIDYEYFQKKKKSKFHEADGMMKICNIGTCLYLLH